MSSKGHLGLNLFEANLKRHPSVKGLFDEKGNKKSPVDSKNEVLLLNVDNKSEKESNDTSKNQDDELEEKIKDIDLDNEEEKDDNKDNIFHKDNIKQISVTINRVQEKLVDNTTSFFTELNDEDVLDIFKVARYLGPRMMNKLGARALTCGINYGDSQAVKHVHLHLLPDYTIKEKSDRDLDEIYEIIKED